MLFQIVYGVDAKFAIYNQSVGGTALWYVDINGDMWLKRHFQLDGNITSSGLICDSTGCIGSGAKTSPINWQGHSSKQTTGCIGLNGCS